MAMVRLIMKVISRYQVKQQRMEQKNAQGIQTEQTDFSDDGKAVNNMENIQSEQDEGSDTEGAEKT